MFFETDFRNNARERINQMKNQEIVSIMGNEWVATTIKKIYEEVIMIVKDVAMRHVKHAVRNHVRFHL